MGSREFFTDADRERAKTLSEDQLEFYREINRFERSIYPFFRAGSKVVKLACGAVAGAVIPVNLALTQEIQQEAVYTAGGFTAMGLICWGFEKYSRNQLSGKVHQANVLLADEALRRAELKYEAVAALDTQELPAGQQVGLDVEYLQAYLFNDAEPA